MLGVLQHNANAFSYVVTYLAPGGISRHASRLVTSRTPYHPHQNAISFQLASGSPRMTRFKIMSEALIGSHPVVAVTATKAPRHITAHTRLPHPAESPLS
ncbi:hypothetical protein MRX96_043750 [Rhipicephalus microplus]